METNWDFIVRKFLREIKFWTIYVDLLKLSIFAILGAFCTFQPSKCAKSHENSKSRASNCVEMADFETLD